MSNKGTRGSAAFWQKHLQLKGARAELLEHLMALDWVVLYGLVTFTLGIWMGIFDIDEVL